MGFNRMQKRVTSSALHSDFDNIKTITSFTCSERKENTMETQPQDTGGKADEKEDAKIGIIPSSELKGSDADTAYPDDAEQGGQGADRIAEEVKGSDAEPDGN